MPHLLAVAIAATLALSPVRAAASATWGSPQYGDPPYFCLNQSDMQSGGYASWPATNDPLVSDNPDWDLSGLHPDPGYDDWWGAFYGDFRGQAGDTSGWTYLTTDYYPNHAHWDPSYVGWAIHGHAKMYLAYYNWTFGGQCGWGWYGNPSPPPYMAPQGGYGVMDLYVDAVPPYPPQPMVTGMTTSSVTFSWDPVSDRGDGQGQDYFAIGMGGYTSWLTLNGASLRQQQATTSDPRVVTQSGMSSSDSACVHVIAFDKLQNATPEQVLCTNVLPPPPAPQWPAMTSSVAANPSPGGLVGLETWFWLNPAPAAIAVDEDYKGRSYRFIATPRGASWSFGDGSTAAVPGANAYGLPYPQQSSVRYVYQKHSQAGYKVSSTVQYDVTWTANINGKWVGPYPYGQISRDAIPLLYSVAQAEPELTSAA